MINTNYRIDALKILLDEKCLSERYYSLIEYKDKLIKELKNKGIEYKNDIIDLSDNELIQLGLKDLNIVKLFRRFLTIYDVSSSKLKEIEKLEIDESQRSSFKELYLLPGVKQIRANLYYLSGHKSLNDFIDTNEKAIIEKIEIIITKNKLSCSVPLPKEVRTHIAVAKAFLNKH